MEEKNKIVRTDFFSKWLKGLKDKKVAMSIVSRIRQAAMGNFGDCESVGDGVFEMRIHIGCGHRVYFVRKSLIVYVILLGGKKSSQDRDIRKAKKLAKEMGLI